MLSEEQVRHVAKLARISLTEAEIKKFSTQLSKVIGYMDILNEVDTKKVAETSQVTGLKNIMGEDEIKKSPCSREELLACSELSVDSHQVRVKKAIDK